MSDSLADNLFGPALADRPCGDCVVCCVTPKIDTPEFSKAEGEACVHCTGSGCAIYDARPQVCRTFNCAWKRIATMPPETRPDRLGVMISVQGRLPPRNLFENLYFVLAATGDAAALDQADVREAIFMLSAAALPVFVSAEGIKTLVHPAPGLADAILNPAPQRDRALVREGRDWVRRYAPFARASAGEQASLPYGL